MAYETREIASGLNNPWEIRFREDWIFFTERPGRFSKVNVITGEKKQLLHEEDCLQWGESGMLGFDFHPDFPDSMYIYVAYVHQDEPPPELEVFRYRYTGDSLVDRTSIFGPIKAFFVHNGCRVVMHDRQIYLSLGDVEERDSAQSLTNPHGKILRLNLDGSIPEDNPFPNSPIWSYGHRNPQGLEFAPNGLLYSSEHGTSIEDEINIIQSGKNFGWPLVEGYCDLDYEKNFCNERSIVEPLMSWTPTVATGDIGFYHYDSCREWNNSLLVATLKDQSLYQVMFDSSGTTVLGSRRMPIMLTWLNEQAGRLRSICFSPEGRVFLSTGNSQESEMAVDRIIELRRIGAYPSLIGPPDSGIVAYQLANFVWSHATGDHRYQLQISTTKEFEAGDIIIDTIIADTTLIINDLPLGSSLYWRVREASPEGIWSFAWKFSTVESGVAPISQRRNYRLSTLPNRILIDFLGHALSGTVNVVNVLGVEVRSIEVKEILPGGSVSIPNLTPGYYLVNVTIDGKLSTHQVIVR